MKRGEDYEAIKDELSSRLIEVLEREVPQIAGKIAYSELSTPLSTRHFGGYDEGEIYGLEHTPARFRERALKPKTGSQGVLPHGSGRLHCRRRGSVVRRRALSLGDFGPEPPRRDLAEIAPTTLAVSKTLQRISLRTIVFVKRSLCQQKPTRDPAIGDG